MTENRKRLAERMYTDRIQNKAGQKLTAKERSIEYI